MGDEFGLVQIIEEPTRGENTLDLIYTNETSMIIQVENIKSTLSDHDRIEVTTNVETKNEEEIIENKNENDKGMKKLNYNSDGVEWNGIRNELEEVQWSEIFKDRDTEACLGILLEVIIGLCKKYIPEKKSRDRDTVPGGRR